MEEEIVLNCSYNKFKKNFLKHVAPDSLTIETIYRNHKENVFIGNIRESNFHISYNKSFILVNHFSIWTIDQLIAPTVMVGTIENLDEPIRIKLTFTKRESVLFIGKVFLISPMVLLLLCLIFINQLETPFIYVLIVMLKFSGIGIYLLHIPREDKKRLLDYLISIT